MSFFTDLEETIERGFRKWTENLFGPAETDQLLLVHRAIFEQVLSKVQTVQKGRRVFPYNHLRVRLVSPDADKRALYHAAFGDERRLETEIRETLAGAGCQTPAGFALEIETAEAGTSPFEIEYAVRAEAAPVPQPARVTVASGKAERVSYELEKARTNIGRQRELTDASGRILRRNDVVFEEAAEGVNTTVSRSHAHIRREGAEYRICDDGSKYGTRIFREGRSIEVPPGGRRGERLQNGDEIYLGRACLQFER